MPRRYAKKSAKPTRMPAFRDGITPREHTPHISRYGERILRQVG